MDGGVAERLTGPGPVVGPVSRTGQDGTVLFLGLALLLAITAAALSAAQTTSLELRMSRNSHDAALAFHAADAALAEAESTTAIRPTRGSTRRVRPTARSRRGRTRPPGARTAKWFGHPCRTWSSVPAISSSG